MRPFRILKDLMINERGFSLTEVLVGGGILAGVALAGARMFGDQNSAQKIIQLEQKLSLHHQNIVKQMNMAGNCNATFKRAGLYNLAFASNTNLANGIVGCVGPTCIDQNRNSDNSVNLSKDANSVDITTTHPLLIPYPTGTPPETAYIDDTQVWFPRSTVLMTSRATTGPVTIRVTYALNPRLGNKTVIKDIIVNARFADGLFKECLSGQESTINNLQSDFCKSLNYGDITSTGTNVGKLATWDEATQTCLIGTEKNCDTPGMFVDGVDETGIIRCRPLVQPGDAASLEQNDPPANCANPILTLDTEGKMTVKCP